jgi:hypothetical protein
VLSYIEFDGWVGALAARVSECMSILLKLTVLVRLLLKNNLLCLNPTEVHCVQLLCSSIQILKSFIYSRGENMYKS